MDEPSLTGTLIQALVSVLGSGTGVLIVGKLVVTALREDIREVRSTTVDAHRRIDDHLQRHSGRSS